MEEPPSAEAGRLEVAKAMPRELLPRFADGALGELRILLMHEEQASHGVFTSDDLLRNPKRPSA
jgi:hypothetical protein